MELSDNEMLSAVNLSEKVRRANSLIYDLTELLQSIRSHPMYKKIIADPHFFIATSLRDLEKKVESLW